jgi:sulfide:quinone oxidoreductase
MDEVLILGAGTGGLILANKLAKLVGEEVRITLVDRSTKHVYQPGFTLIPFGIYSVQGCTKPVANFLPKDVELFRGEVEKIDPDKKEVTAGGRVLSYDWLVIATGCRPAFEEVEGLHGALYEHVHEFYTLRGAKRLRRVLRGFTSGKLVISVADMPIKCPGAPLSFAFLADEFFRRRGLRKEVEIILTTSLPEAFSKPEVAKTLEALAEERGIEIVPNFPLAEVDSASKRIRSPTGEEIPYDLLVVVPPHMGSEAIISSGMGDAMGYVGVDKHHLNAIDFEDTYALGDAANLPTSKAASSTHFQAGVVAKNLAEDIAGSGIKTKYGGEAFCFILTGFSEAMVVGFDYERKLYHGRVPLPLLGPLSLNKVTKGNHIAKLLSRWFYWHLWLRGEDFPYAGGAE